MTDIVERLRQPLLSGGKIDPAHKPCQVVENDAADEIEWLRAALQEIVRQGGAEDTLAAIARRALEPKP